MGNVQEQWEILKKEDAMGPDRCKTSWWLNWSSIKSISQPILKDYLFYLSC